MLTVKFVPWLVLRLAHHQRQPQRPAALLGERQADQAAAVARHEVDVLGPHAGRGHEQVALVLALLVVHHDDHAPGGELGKQFLDAVHARPRDSSSRSR